jgi:hypothetical protein
MPPAFAEYLGYARAHALHVLLGGVRGVEAVIDHLRAE